MKAFFIRLAFATGFFVYVPIAICVACVTAPFRR
jgi:hypothetical protein